MADSSPTWTRASSRFDLWISFDGAGEPRGVGLTKEAAYGESIEHLPPNCELSESTTKRTVVAMSVVTVGEVVRSCNVNHDEKSP